MNKEEKEWIVYESGYEEGYSSGIVDFVAVKREVLRLEKLGYRVILTVRERK